MRRTGFTLVEIAVVLVIVGFILAMALRMTGALVESQRRYTTRDRITLTDIALTSYVSQMARLPCPADGALPPTDTLYGFEQRDGAGNCLNAQARGVVPWRTLGMSENDATDGYYTRLTYRVGPGLALPGALNLAQCDPAGGTTYSGSTPYQTCNPGCVAATLATCTNSQAVVAGKGLAVRAATGGAVIADPAANPATGAAYVLVSHGPNRVRGYSVDGILQTDVGSVGDGERQNDASAPLAAFYVDQNPTDASDNTHFDDQVSKPTLLVLTAKASIGPRAH